MAALVPSKNHNIIANLNEHHEDAADYVQIIRFLKRSEIFYALTAEVDIYTDQIREFWTHAEFRTKDDRRVILSKVQGQKIEITESSIRFVLRFKSADNTILSNPDLYGLIDRMGYEGDRNAPKLFKGQVSYLWRYIWHVIIHVFAARSTGWDNLNRELAVAVCCLCTKRPFNWAGMIFENLRRNATDTLKNKLFLYPRFLQLIINYKLKGLSHEGHILELALMRNRIFKDMKSVHPKSTFSGRFTDIFESMKEAVPREERVTVEEVEESESEEEREFDPRTKKMVKKVSVPQERLQDDSSESETESEPEPIAKSKGTSRRIIIKKSTPAPPAPSAEPRKKRVVKKVVTSPPSKKQRVESPRIEMPSPPASPSPRSTPEIDELKKIVLKLSKDMEAFQSTMKKEIAEIPQKVVDRLKAEGWSKGTSSPVHPEDRTGDDDVIMVESEVPEPTAQYFEASEPIITEPAETDLEDVLRDLEDSRIPSSSEIILHKVYQRPTLEVVEEDEIPNVSLMSLEDARKVVESRFTPDGKALMSDAERRTIEKLYKQEVKIFSQCNVSKLLNVDRRFLTEGKGKQIVDLNEEIRVGDESELVCVKKSGQELVQHCEGLLFETAFKNPTIEFNVFEGKNGWYCQADQYEWSRLEKMWLSVCWQDLNEIEIIGSSDTVLIEDIDVEAQLSDLEQGRQMKVKLQSEKKMMENIMKLDIMERIKARMDSDTEFAKIFNRLRSYFGEKADDLYYKEPEEIVSLCAEKECTNISLILQEAYKIEKPSQQDIMQDLAFDMDTVSAVDLKKFLKKHGYISYELNKKTIEDMKADAKQVQLCLVKMLDRESAETLLDSGEYNLPEGYDNRARFFSGQFPFISSYRIIHWKYDHAKRCFLVKRVTGATHALYSTYEVARLTEEDLYELADLPLYNPSKDESAYQFARWLKRQKCENFDAIDFDKPDSIKADTIKYLRAERIDMREIMRDQYLCLKFKDVPRKSTSNLLDNMFRWYLDDKTFDFVIELQVKEKNQKPEQIRFYHPAELNMFTRDDLIKLSKTPPVGKRLWNAYIFEMIQGVLENLIKCLPDEQQLVEMQKEAEQKEKRRKKDNEARRKRRGARQEKNIQIMD